MAKGLSEEEQARLDALVKGESYYKVDAKGGVFYNLGEKIEEGAEVCRKIMSFQFQAKGIVSESISAI